MIRRIHADTGFTLVELLVSLLVLGFVGLFFAAGIGTGRGIWDRLDQRTRRLDDVEAAQALIRDRLQRVVPTTRYDASQPYVDFGGTADRVFFTAPAAPARGSDAIAAYRLSMSTGAELVLSAASDLDPEFRPQRDDAVLLRRVAAIDIAYFGIAAPDNTRRWRDEWYLRPRPPELVRIRVAFPAGDPRVWPDLLVRPASTIDTACVLASGSASCKGR